ncbi:MAG: hypothetical protein NTX49_05035 [Chlamydiae bacterium]|nr:hypothetical protein [Chlamydiota bacterium]
MDRFFFLFLGVLSFLVGKSSLVATEEDSRKITICATVPKAGTNLIRKALMSISGESVRWFGMKPFKNADPENFFATSKQKIYITHLFPDMDVIKDLDPSKFAKVLMIRDPRDVMVSFAYHLASKKMWPFGKLPDKAQFLNLPWDGQLREALLFPPLSPKDTFPFAAEWMQDPTILVIRFEDLVGSKGGGSDIVQRQTLFALANHIGCPLPWERIDEIASQLFGGTGTFRSGQIGDYLKSYSPENEALYDELLGQYTEALGY